ncbi:MAG: hypothetical protein F6K42_00160 [Leptolyngbya sp. SIO1D8]|nr:hypothetical protein [Leptolyngbya sp. SIO1D8]
MSAIERLTLIQTLNRLPTAQFNELVMALNPPGGILPSNLAAQGDRTPVLLQWVEGPTGPGLPQLQTLLNLILHPGVQSLDSPSETTSAPAKTTGQSSSRRSFYERQLAQLEEELTAVEGDMETAANESTRMKLEKKAEQLLDKIETLNAKLNEL